MDLENDTFIVKTDSGELCRLCANTDNQLIPIFKGEGIEHNISSKIEKHLPIIKVTEQDKLPLQICYQCASTLIAWHNLYEGCRIADNRLREILSIDEKLPQYMKDDESLENYTDDFRDDYEEESQNNFVENVQLASISNSSQLNEVQTLGNTEINEHTDTKIFDETENENHNDERYACKMNDKQKWNDESTNFMKADPDENRQNSENARIVDNSIAEDKCECSKMKDTKCSNCIESDSLRCNYCPMVFLDKNDIRRHLQVSHRELYTFKNNVGKINRIKLKTEKKLKSRSLTMRIHKSVAANTVNEEIQNGNDERHVYQCKICSKICLSFRGLTRHNVVHKNDSFAVSCNYCTHSFANNEEKQKHISEYHRINVADNDNEDVKIKLEQADVAVINESMMQKRKEEDFTWCTNRSVEQKNGQKEIVKNELEIEKKRHRKNDSVGGKIENFKCSDCEKTFEKKSSFIRHQLIHSATAASTVTCDICGKQFSSELLLKRHKNSSHRNKRVKLSEEEDPFRRWYVFADGQKHLKCDQCKYNSLWYHKGRFLEHYRIHTGEKPFTCDLCGKQFRTKTLLQKHVMFVHEGIKEHPCDICGRRFSDKRYMEDHRRIHTGERPYVCDLCGKTFKQSASLFIHKELHKGLRKHVCEMCSKRFTTRSSLTIHIKRHIGERNFVCATCGKAFVDGKHLKDHMAVHSEERPFSCELCGGRFKLMKHLKQHGRTHKRDYAA